MRRIGIYFIYDKDGIVDEYCIYYLLQLKKVLSYLLVVSNGELCEAGREKMSAIADDVFERENVGYDAWAYKEAMEHIGWDILTTYDELVITNYTVYGPVYPFETVFAEMGAFAVDFWGVSLRREDRKQKGYGGRPTPYGYIPELIASNFWVIRQRLLKNPLFKNHWDTLPPIYDYFDACNLNEPVFTKCMSDHGFTYCTYDTIKGENLHYTIAPVVQNMKTYTLIKDYKVPIIRRKAFYAPYQEVVPFQTGIDIQNLLTYLDTETDYDVNLIYDNLFRTASQYEYRPVLGLDRTFSQRAACMPVRKECKIALAIFTDSLLYMEELLKYISFFEPLSADIYLLFRRSSDQFVFETIMPQQKWPTNMYIRHYTVTTHFLAQLPQIIPVERYEYLCILNNHRANRNQWEIANESQLKWCWDSLAGSTAYVQNVLAYLEESPRIGILCPQPSLLQNSTKRGGENWDGGFRPISRYAPFLGIHVPFSGDHPPAAPFEKMCWIRTSALRSFWSVDWAQAERDQLDWVYSENVAAEQAGLAQIKSIPISTLFRFSDKLISLFAQESGYATAYITTDTYAMVEINKYKHCLKQERKRSKRLVPPQPGLNNVGRKTLFKMLVKRTLPQNVWNVLRSLKTQLLSIKRR